MSREQPTQPIASTPKQEARALDAAHCLFDVNHPPRLIGADVMAAVFGIGVSAFYKNAKLGKYDVFKVDPPCGPKCYSGILLARYLKGESLYVPTFGARRKRA